MGGCCSQGAPYISYPYELPLQIEQTFTIEGKRKGADLKLSLGRPRYSEGYMLELSDNTHAKISACGLAGFNARQKQECDYQDRVHYIVQDTAVFGFVLDGHGPRGKEMAETCQVFFVNYFKTHLALFNEPNDKVFEDLFQQCNAELREVYASNEANPDTHPLDDGQFSGV